jgi:hypothetical protein
MPYGPEHYYRSVPPRQSLRAPGLPPDPYYQGGLGEYAEPHPSFDGGDFGLNAETNPMVAHDDQNNVVPFYQGPKYKPPYYAHVDSSRRDCDAYPNPQSFRLKFDKPLRGVFSIELLDIVFPNVLSTATEPENRIVYLLSGIVTEGGSGNDFNAMQPDNLGVFHTMMPHTANDPAVDNSSLQFQLADYALAKFRYDPTQPNQFWERHDWHKTKHFHPPHNSLAYLDFALTDRLGNLYPMDRDDNWTASLMIMSKQ